MKLFKKISLISVICFICISFFSIAFANNRISNISIVVEIQNDGSAIIKQEWTGNFTEGTENYIPINTKGISVSNFKVSDEKMDYTEVPDWNIDASFNEKQNTYGIHKTDGGVELCFGISEYGDKNYEITYTVENFINAYNSSDGTNFMFVNPNMNTTPTTCSVLMYLENGKKLTEENAKIWAFGYTGQVMFRDGKIVAYTEKDIEDSQYMVVMVELNKGVITPKTSIDKEFSDVKDIAFENSDYDSDKMDLKAWLILICVGFMLLIPIIAMIKFIIVNYHNRKFYKQVEYFRGAPADGDLEKAYFLGQGFKLNKDESSIIGATLLTLINDKCIEPQITEDVGFFGNTKQEIELKLIKEPYDGNQKALYNILEPASQGDGILQEKELKVYARKHYTALRKYINRARRAGQNSFVNSNGFTKTLSYDVRKLTDNGKRELAELIGLKKYLLDFSLISEREITEISIWKEYLVYAMLFGISDKVMKQLKDIYPNDIAEIQRYHNNTYLAYGYYNTMYRSARQAEQRAQAARSGGSGGSSSFGGGGGFSGGGSGGGSR